MFHDQNSKQLCRAIRARGCEELSEPGACKAVLYVSRIKVIEKRSTRPTPKRRCRCFSPPRNLTGREAGPFAALSVSQVTGPVTLTPAAATTDGFPSESVTKIVPSTFAPTVSVCLPEANSGKHEVVDNGAITVETTRALMTEHLLDIDLRSIERLLACLLLIVVALAPVR